MIIETYYIPKGNAGIGSSRKNKKEDKNGTEI